MKPTKDRTKLNAVWLPADVMRNKHHERECTYSRVIHCDDGSAEVDESCICDRLRACEQRVSKEALQDAKARESNGITWAQAYSAALNAAREAVFSCHLRLDSGKILRQGGDWENAIDKACRAIDALQTKP